jgi:hypothetical protein
MKNYIIQKGKSKFTPFAGIKLFSDLFDNLNFKNKINSGFSLPNSNRGYAPYTYIKSIISGLLLGADCMTDLDNIKRDTVLKEIIGTEVPHSTRIGSFLYSADTKKIDLMHSLMQEVSVKGIKEKGLSEVTLDADATFVETDKEGVSSYCYKNFKALSMLLGFISETGSCIYNEFREGNTSPSLDLDKQLESVHSYLSSNNIRLKNYRSDSAGYQNSIINYCNLNNINFFIRGKNVREQDYSNLNFKPLNDRYGFCLDDMEIAETVHAMDRTEAFRLIVTRKKKKYKDPSLFGEYYYEYYGIATNSNLSKEEVFHFYNKRGQCEYYIKSIKWDLSLRKLPSGSFNGNALWSNIALLSYNVVKLFSVLTGINKSLKSLRYALISAVGSIVNHANRIVLKLHLDDFKFERFLSLRRIIV